MAEQGVMWIFRATETRLVKALFHILTTQGAGSNYVSYRESEPVY